MNDFEKAFLVFDIFAFMTVRENTFQTSPQVKPNLISHLLDKLVQRVSQNFLDISCWEAGIFNDALNQDL